MAAAARLFCITGDASATDPVCTLAPTHHLIESARVITNSEVGQVLMVLQNQSRMRASIRRLESAGAAKGARGIVCGL